MFLFKTCESHTNRETKMPERRKLRNGNVIVDYNVKPLFFNDNIQVFDDTRRQHRNSILPPEKCIRTPLCTSCSGSYTVEASIILPLMISLMAMVVFLCQLFLLQFTIVYSMQESVKEFCRMPPSMATSMDKAVWIGLCDSKIYKSDAPTHLIRGGVLGLDYSQTSVDTDDIRAHVSYSVTCPLPLLGNHGVTMQAVARGRRWSGWNPEDKAGDGVYVYVTKNGSAYHKTSACVYLNPGTYGIAKNDLVQARNDSGSKYKACPYCHAAEESGYTVYISKYGEVYHSTLGCKQLKRHISRIRMEDANGYHPCPKCAS